MVCHTVLESGLQMAINCMISRYKTLYSCAFTGVGGSRQHDVIRHLPAKIQLLRSDTTTYKKVSPPLYTFISNLYPAKDVTG